MNKVKFLSLSITFIGFFFFISCGSSDDNDSMELEPGLYQITIAELESQPSFIYENKVTNINTYLWFRNGIMTIKDKKETKYNYTINGKKFTIETIDKKHTYFGYIQKSVSKRKNQLAITKGADGVVDGNLPDDIMNWYDYCSTDMSK